MQQLLNYQFNYMRTEKDVPGMYTNCSISFTYYIALLIDVTHVICKKYE